MIAFTFPRRRCSAFIPPRRSNTAGPRVQGRLFLKDANRKFVTTPRQPTLFLCALSLFFVCWDDEIWANYSLPLCKATAQPPLIQIVSPPHSLKVPTERTLPTTCSTWRIMTPPPLYYFQTKPKHFHDFRLEPLSLLLLPLPSIYTRTLAHISSSLISLKIASRSSSLVVSL